MGSLDDILKTLERLSKEMPWNQDKRASASMDDVAMEERKAKKPPPLNLGPKPNKGFL